MDENQTMWHVTGQVQGYGIGPDGRAGEGVTVYFTTARGANGSVFVPRHQYNQDMVRQQVSQMAAEMDAVGMLTGG